MCCWCAFRSRNEAEASSSARVPVGLIEREPGRPRTSRVRLFEAKALTSFPAGLLIRDYNEEIFFVWQTSMPVSANGLIILGAGVNADGILWARASSIRVRIVEMVGIGALVQIARCRRIEWSL